MKLNELQNKQLASFYFQPLEQWTVENVIDLMAALNLYRYAELFREQAMSGKHLQQMNESMLTVSTCQSFLIPIIIYKSMDENILTVRTGQSFLIPIIILYINMDQKSSATETSESVYMRVTVKKYCFFSIILICILP